RAALACSERHGPMQIRSDGGEARRGSGPPAGSPPRSGYTPITGPFTRSAALLPPPRAHQPAAAALVLAVVCAQAGAVPPVARALPRVVRVAVRRAPLPEVAPAALAAPAVPAVGTGGAAPEGAERLHAPARRAALRARRRSPPGPSRRRGLRHHTRRKPSRRHARAFVLLHPLVCVGERRTPPVAHCHGTRSARGILPHLSFLPATHDSTRGAGAKKRRRSVQRLPDLARASLAARRGRSARARCPDRGMVDEVAPGAVLLH